MKDVLEKNNSFVGVYSSQKIQQYFFLIQNKIKNKIKKNK